MENKISNIIKSFRDRNKLSDYEIINLKYAFHSDNLNKSFQDYINDGYSEKQTADIFKIALSYLTGIKINNISFIVYDRK